MASGVMVQPGFRTMQQMRQTPQTPQRVRRIGEDDEIKDIFDVIRAEFYRLDDENTKSDESEAERAARYAKLDEEIAKAYDAYYSKALDAGLTDIEKLKNKIIKFLMSGNNMSTIDKINDIEMASIILTLHNNNMWDFNSVGNTNSRELEKKANAAATWVLSPDNKPLLNKSRAKVRYENYKARIQEAANDPEKHKPIAIARGIYTKLDSSKQYDQEFREDALTSRTRKDHLIDNPPTSRKPKATPPIEPPPIESPPIESPPIESRHIDTPRFYTPRIVRPRNEVTSTLIAGKSRTRRFNNRRKTKNNRRKSKRRKTKKNRRKSKRRKTKNNRRKNKN
jgi:hypothetical protein